MKHLLVLTLAFFAIAGQAEASVVYRNSVGLKPGEFARFVVDPTVPIPHTVRVTDRRTGDRIHRTVSRFDTRAHARFNGLRVRIRFQSRLVTRVFNGSNRGRRVRVLVSR